MSPKSWEERLTDAYWDYRWRQIMDPLCETFQAWKAGQLGHNDVDVAIDKAYKEKCMINNLLGQRPDRSAAIIHWWDPEWFATWIEENRPPHDVDLTTPSVDAPNDTGAC